MFSQRAKNEKFKKIKKPSPTKKIVFAGLLLIMLVTTFFVFGRDLIKIWPSTKKDEPKSSSIEHRTAVATYCQLLIEKKPVEMSASSTPLVVDKNIKETDTPAVERCFSVDEKGLAFKGTPLITGGPFLVIYDRSGRSAEINQQIIKPAVLAFAIELKNNIEFGLLDITIISPIADDLEVRTRRGWMVYFDAAGDLTKQLNTLKKLLTQEIKPLEYVDLRIENKVFYK